MAASLLLLPVPAVAFDVSAVDVENADTNPDAGLQALIRFWAFERLVIDGSEPVPLRPVLNHEVVAKARPDECFAGVGQPYPPLSIDESGKPSCELGKEKVNEAYVWGLAGSNDHLYFGTIANTHCLVLQSYLGQNDSNLTPYWVCESSEGVARTDHRPPKLYRYAVAGGPAQPLTVPPGAVTALLASTTGIRSAGALNGVVLFAGLSARGGVNFFAFEGATGEFLAAKNLPYTDIRQWLEHDGVLYTAVGTRVESCQGRAGAVLRWTGVKSTVADEVIRFEEVGDLDAPGAYLVELGGRIYISSWPSGGQSGCLQDGKPVSDFRYAGITRGPVIPEGGLTAAHRGQWTKLWSFDQYDPDPITAMSYGGGALHGFEGALFWGTMHVPFNAATRASKTLDLDADGSGTVDGVETLVTALGTHRSISIFKMLAPASEKPRVDLLYGELYLPKYDPALKRYTIAYDAEHMNGLGRPPLHGASGFGSFWNNYTWIMNVYDGSLYVGTMDWLQLARVGLTAALDPEKVTMTPPELPFLEKVFGSNLPVEGADLFRFDNKYEKAIAESFDGLGNFTNYGLRTVLNADGKMFIGSANPMNLHPAGGWELIALKPWFEPGAPVTGDCSHRKDWEPCDDGDLCTRLDVCRAGVCVGKDAVECVARDTCHVAGKCIPSTGTCEEWAKPDGHACDDANACTTNDTCTAGACAGTPFVTCVASDQCHVAGVCDPKTGTCTDPAKTDGELCDDGDACTEGDVCRAGRCVATAPTLATVDPCRVPASCDPITGATLPAADGTPCPEGVCVEGVCVGETVTQSPDPQEPAVRSDLQGEPVGKTASEGSGCGCGAAGLDGGGAAAAFLFGLLALSRRRTAR